MIGVGHGGEQALVGNLVHDVGDAVGAHVNGLQAHFLGLGQNQGSFRAIEGKEHGVGRGSLDVGQLRLKVHIREGRGFLGHNLQPAHPSLGLKSGNQAQRIGAVIAIQNGNLLIALVGGEISHHGALEIIDKAGAEHVGLAFVNVVGGAGSGHHRDAVLSGQRGHHAALPGQHVAQDGGAAGVQMVEVNLLGLGIVGRVVFPNDFHGGAVNAAGRVDLINAQIRAVLHRKAVHGIGAGQRREAADLDGIFRQAGYRQRKRQQHRRNHHYKFGTLFHTETLLAIQNEFALFP